MQDTTTTIECESCHKNNRVPLDRLGDKPKCGSCGSLLPLGGGPIEVRDDNFDQVISTSPVPVIVDFWAPWCGPCRMIGPTLEKIASSKPYEVLVAKLNVDDNPRMAERFQVRSIPMIVAFHQGEAIDTQVGALPPASLTRWVDGVIERTHAAN